MSNGHPFSPDQLPVVGPTQRSAPMMTSPPMRPRRKKQDPNLDLGFLIATWSRWWKVLVPISLLAVCLSSVLIFMVVVPKYRASSWLQIREHKDWLITPSKEETDGYVQTQIEMIRSPVVLTPVLQNTKIADLMEIRESKDPVKWLSKFLEINNKEGSHLFEVAFVTGDPHAAATVVNGVVDTYLKLHTEQSRERNEWLMSKLQETQKEKEQVVARNKVVLEQLLARVHQLDPSAPSPLDGQRIEMGGGPLKDLQKELSATELEISLTKAKIESLEQSPDSFANVQRAAVLREVYNDPRLQQLRLQLQTTQERKTRYEEVARGGAHSSRVHALQREIDQLERRISSMEVALTREYSEQLSELERLSRIDQQEEWKDTLAQLQVRSAHLQEEMRTMRDVSENTGGLQTELNMAYDNYQDAQNLVAKIKERIVELQTESTADSRVMLIKEAPTPLIPLPLGLWKHLLAALAASFAVPFALSVLWERAACRITSADQLEAQIELPVIGEVARLPVRAAANGKVKSSTMARSMVMFEESIDAIRTNLLLQPDYADIQVVAVCSSVASEGKTSVASQLAVSLARATGKPTLLVDGDMRAPDIHSVFDVPIAPGLVKVLDGEVNLDDAIYREWNDHVHLLPAGLIDKNPHKLLGQNQFHELLDQARLEYRYIVIDTPPILAASESLVMARAADGVLVCAMHEHSRGNHIRMTYDRLTSAGARPMGAVLSGVSVRSYEYKYGSYGYGGEGRYKYAYSRY